MQDTLLASRARPARARGPHGQAPGRAHHGRAGLQLLAPVAGDRALRDDAPLHAARAELLRRAGDRVEADAAYADAIALAANEAQRAELERRRAGLDGPAADPVT